MSVSAPCPCQSQTNYPECCESLHLGKQQAATAEALMRSRYAAYVLQNINYIVMTTIPAQQHLLNRAEMLAWSKDTQWDGLEIVQHQAKVDKTHAQVEFKAYFQTDTGRQSHHELSTFVHIDGKWYFLDPTITMSLTMKQPCLCGSGKKFKQCCAIYL